MLELEEALARILEAIPTSAPEVIPVSDADGRVVVAPVLAKIDLPGFDNSSVDGYAVRAADTQLATPQNAVRLRLSGRVAAGENFKGTLGPGGCVRLFTGSPIPDGANAVVMQEDTRLAATDPKEIHVMEAVKPRENVRFRGEDVRAGSVLMREGEVMSVGGLGLLAAAGVSEVQAGVRPIIGVLATGSELREPGRELKPGQIYESNRSAIAALIKRAGAIPCEFPIVPDSLPATRQSLATAFERCDMVVTCGGVSVGEMDFVKAAFEELGGTLDFWKIAVKPGKPFVFGTLGKKFLFGLPGNPVSALVTFVLLVRPAARRWQGAENVFLPVVQATLGETLSNPGERRHFMRVHLAASGVAHSTGAQASHVLSSLATANGLVDVPPRTTIEAGTPVKVLAWS